MAKREKNKLAPDEAFRIASNVDVVKYTKALLKNQADMDNLRGDRSGIFDQAKNAGCDVKALKATVKLMKNPIDEETRIMVNIYLEKNGQLRLFKD